MKHLRRHRVHLAVLLCGLVVLATAERRLAYLDFTSDGSTRLENNDKPDGDEIINRLIFFDNSTEPIVPTVREVCHARVIRTDSCAHSLIVVRLSESRAPPLSLASQA